MGSDLKINCEWGLNGLNYLLPVSDVIIIIDVLSFSTCVDVALSAGADVYPYPYKDDSAIEFAKTNNAVLANFKRSKTELSLSPFSLLNIAKNEKLVLPSPNGSELSLSTGNVITLCSCFRNCEETAKYAMSRGRNISVIPAGEKWQDGSMRFAIEDYLGAGAVISYLNGSLSAEAKASLDFFNSQKSNLKDRIIESISGKELIDKGFPEDVDLASEFNVSAVKAELINGIYTNIY